MQKSITKLYDHHNNVYAEIKSNLESFGHFAKHSHDTFSLSIVKDGEVEIWYHNAPTRILNTKSIAIYNPNQVHMARNKSSKPIPYLNMHFQTDWCLSIQREIFGDIDAFLPVKPFLLADNELRKRLISLSNKINENDISLEKIFREILFDLFHSYSYIKEENKPHAVLERIEHYIINHIDQKIEIESIASEVGYSSAYINRLFKQHYGLTPHAFMIDKRIQKAKELISIHPESSLTDIAYQAGFYDQSHFIKKFKKVYSLSPNNYKLSK